MPQSKFEQAYSAIDQANAQDPRIENVAGKQTPRELLYSIRMREWAKQLAPDASEELFLAIHAQHIERWKTPRLDYPMDRKGYLAWREDLKKFHAERLGTIMKTAGYAESSIQKAQKLILWKNKSPDPEGQILEDAACLVFLQYDFSEFAKKTDAEKVIGILKKTWLKMSPPAREAALTLSYPPHVQPLLKKALG